MNGALFLADLEIDRQPDDTTTHRRDVTFIESIDYDSLPLDELHDLVLDRTSVLTSEAESRLFLQMNRAYYYAAQRRHDPREATGTRGEGADAELSRGDRIRNQLLVIFHKLTVSIAKRFVTSRHSLEELVSEGDAVLLRAISLFDPSRGFRFSTYATYAVRRRLARYVASLEHSHATPIDFREGPPLPDPRRWTLPYEQAMETGVQWLETALYQLSQRERYIVRCRFGWGREFEPRTLQEIADELGVSRERIRQLEVKAIQKLRAMAAKIDLVAF